MKKLFIILFLLLFGCAKPMILFEQDQLNTSQFFSLIPSSNYEKYNVTNDFKKLPIPANAVFVTAEIIKIFDYSDHAMRTDSLATWPHLHLVLEIIDGVLPSKENDQTKNIEYHLELHSTRKFTIGQKLTFIFTDDCQFYGVQELKPFHELKEKGIIGIKEVSI